MNTFQEYCARDEFAAKLQRTTTSTVSSNTSSQVSPQSASQSSRLSPDPLSFSDDFTMLDTISPSTTSNPSLAPTITQVPGRKRKGESELSRLLSKTKKAKNMAWTDGPDEVERYLASNHCEYLHMIGTMIITNGL